MTHDDLPWHELEALWRAARPARLDGLAERVRRRNRRAAAVLGGELVVALFAFAVLGWLLSTAPPPLWAAWAVFMLAVTVVLLVFSIATRARTWRAERPSLRGLLELSIRQTRSAIRLARGGRLAMLLVLAFTAGWATLEARGLEQPNAWDVGRRAIAYGVVLVYGAVWLAGCRAVVRRKLRELSELEASLEAFARGEPE